MLDVILLSLKIAKIAGISLWKIVYLMECSFWMLSGAALLAVCVGMLTGIFGIGCGFLAAPALMIFLGMPGAIAVGTSIAMICFISSFGIYKRRKSNTIDFKLAAIIATMTSIGVVLGMWMLEKLKTMQPMVIRGKEHIAAQYILLVTFAFMLAAIAVILLLENRKEPSSGLAKGWFAKIGFPLYVELSSLGEQTIPLIPVLSLGFVIGILNGLLGVGGGVIMLPSLIYLGAAGFKSYRHWSVGCMVHHSGGSSWSYEKR